MCELLAPEDDRRARSELFRRVRRCVDADVVVKVADGLNRVPGQGPMLTARALATSRFLLEAVGSCRSVTSSSSEHRPRRQSKSWIQVLGLLPAGVVLFWLSLSSTPVSVTGALSVGAIAICGWKRLRAWSVWLSAPAALAVGTTAPHREEWVPLLVAAFVWRGAVSMARFDEESAGSGVVPALFGISAVGAFICLPDTEQITSLAVVAVVMAIVAVAEPRVAFGRAGSMALVGLFGWIAAAGGIGRPAATIGALGSLGVLLLGGALALVSDRLLVAVHSWMCRGLQSRRRREQGRPLCRGRRRLRSHVDVVHSGAVDTPIHLATELTNSVAEEEHRSVDSWPCPGCRPTS